MPHHLLFVSKKKREEVEVLKEQSYSRGSEKGWIQNAGLSGKFRNGRVHFPSVGKKVGKKDDFTKRQKTHSLRRTTSKAKSKS